MTLNFWVLSDDIKIFSLTSTRNCSMPLFFLSLKIDQAQCPGFMDSCASHILYTLRNDAPRLDFVDIRYIGFWPLGGQKKPSSK